VVTRCGAIQPLEVLEAEETIRTQRYLDAVALGKLSKRGRAHGTL
jgi:hypothetical protein